MQNGMHGTFMPDQQRAKMVGQVKNSRRREWIGKKGAQYGDGKIHPAQYGKYGSKRYLRNRGGDGKEQADCQAAGNALPVELP